MQNTVDLNKRSRSFFIDRALENVDKKPRAISETVLTIGYQKLDKMLSDQII